MKQYVEKRSMFAAINVVHNNHLVSQLLLFEHSQLTDSDDFSDTY